MVWIKKLCALYRVGHTATVAFNFIGGHDFSLTYGSYSRSSCSNILAGKLTFSPLPLDTTQARKALLPHSAAYVLLLDTDELIAARDRDNHLFRTLVKLA